MWWRALTICCLLSASFAESDHGATKLPKGPTKRVDDTSTADGDDTHILTEASSSNKPQVRLPRYPVVVNDEYGYDYSVGGPARVRFPGPDLGNHGYDPLGLHSYGYASYDKQPYKRPYDDNYGQPGYSNGFFEYPDFLYADLGPKVGPSFSDYYDKPPLVPKPVHKPAYESYEASHYRPQVNAVNDDSLHRGVTGNKYGYNPRDRIRPGLEPAGSKGVTPELLDFLRRTLKTQSTPLKSPEGTDGRNRYPGIAG